MNNIFSRIIILLTVLIGAPAFAQMANCDASGNNCSSSYSFPSSGGNMGAFVPPATPSTGITNMDTKSYQERECHGLLGAALKAQGEATAKASNTYSENLALCSPEISRTVTQPDGAVITYTPYATCEKGLAATQKAAVEKATSDFINAIAAMPPYCPKPQK